MTTGKRQVVADKGDTFPKILKYNAETHGDKRIAIRFKFHGVWQPLTWQDYHLNVKYLALGLRCLGFDGDKLLILGNNAPQWYFAELAAQANHGAAVGVHPDLAPAEIKLIAQGCGARFAIVEDQEQVDKLVEIKGALPLLCKIIHWNYRGLARYNDPILMGYNEVRQLGEKYDAEHPGLYEQSVETGKADDGCAVVYASGTKVAPPPTTAALPVAATHTFGSIRAKADELLQVDPWYEHDNLVPRLPPAMAVDQCFAIACHLLSSSTLNFTEDPESYQRDLKEIQPSIVIHGARYWESRAAAVQARSLGSDAVKRLVFRSLMPIGYQMVELKNRKGKPDPLRRLLYGLADTILFRPIKASLGLANARICYSSGVTLSAQVIRFYHALNLPLKDL